MSDQEINKIVYLKHPISAATKAKYNAKGYRIVDEKFKPKTETQSEAGAGSWLDNLRGCWVNFKRWIKNGIFS